jgi:hypothetical protein
VNLINKIRVEPVMEFMFGLHEGEVDAGKLDPDVAFELVAAVELDGDVVVDLLQVG